MKLCLLLGITLMAAPVHARPINVIDDAGAEVLAHATSPTPEQLINDYMRTLDAWSASVSMNVDTKIELPGKSVYEKNCVFHYEEKTKRVKWMWSLARPEENSQKGIWVFDGKRILSADSKGREKYTGFVTQGKHDSLFLLDNPRHQLTYDEHFSHEITESQWGGWLRGKTVPLDDTIYMDFCDYLLTQCESLQIVTTEELSGQKCYVIEGIGKYDGEKTRLWIAPAISHNVLKITQSRPDSSHVPVKDRRNPMSKLKQRKTIVLIDDFMKINEVYVPIAGRHRRVEEGRGARLITIKQSRIVIDPDFEEIRAFSYASFPDGTLLNDLDHPGRKYEIRGGKLLEMTNISLPEVFPGDG